MIKFVDGFKGNRTCTKMKIVADSNIPFLKGVFEPYAEVVYKDGRSIERKDMMLADAVIIRTRTRCAQDTLEGTRVQAIASATIGTDHVDMTWCAANGITVYNAEGCNAGGVMNYVFSALYGMASRHSIKLENATMGVVGVGHVGKRVAEAAEKLGFKVLLCDPPRALREGPEDFLPLEELLAQSNVVSLHVPLNEETHDMAGESFFEAIKPGAVLINTSRGEVVDESALLRARPKLGSLAIDTWCNEPFVNHNLLDVCDIATPHIAGYSYQGKLNGTQMAVRSIARHFGIDQLKNYTPEPESADLTPIGLDVSGKTQGEITALLQYNYPIFTDDFLFRMDPDGFERLRIDYNYRREYYII
ncbi:MAG: 4-phosphoerythronate dehydrogenase [Bacteroidales bacterium]|nr:4-phosphoerythronate dehydrogenase [Bacteroidales bacterium]